MEDRKTLESLFEKYGLDDFRWIGPEDIVVSQWVRMKCLFGCMDFGRRATCPPNVPSLPECERLFSEYKEIALFHFEGRVERPEDRHEWTRGINERLLDLEREVFLSGHHMAFVLYVDPCHICKDCSTDKSDCRLPKKARPSVEALAVDVFTTARGCGYDIDVLTDYDQRMNRFGMLLIG